MTSIVAQYSRCNLHANWSIYEKSIALQGKLNVLGQWDSACFVRTTYSTAEYFTTAGWFLQNINIGDRIRFKTAQYCQLGSKFWTACQCLKMQNQYSMNSHQHCPSSVQCCLGPGIALQSVSVCFDHKLYSQPCSIVLNLYLSFGPEKDQWPGFELVSDVPPTRASRSPVINLQRR